MHEDQVYKINNKLYRGGYELLPLKICPRCDTQRNWEKNNPVLKLREFIVVVVDQNTTKYKIGDGINQYKKLPFRRLDRALKVGCVYTFNPAECPNIIRFELVNPEMAM